MIQILKNIYTSIMKERRERFMGCEKRGEIWGSVTKKWEERRKLRGKAFGIKYGVKTE